MRTHALMYHDLVSSDVDASGFVGAGPARYKLTMSQFVAHLDGMEEVLQEPPDVVDDLLDGRVGSNSWLLTFDDGGASSLAAANELTRRGWRGHFFVTTGRIGDPGFLDESGIVELRRMGHVIGSHSVSHPSHMSALSHPELLEEWRASAGMLSALLGERIRSASVPNGYFSKRVAAAAAEVGLEALFTSDPVRTTRHVSGCLAIGRTSIKPTTSANDASRIADGHWRLWLRDYAAWNLRKAAKAVAGKRYEWLREGVLSRRSGEERVH
jgi:peptidoglycan/xylan/chitin deacetylase (PgdA/CDA1 family)